MFCTKCGNDLKDDTLSFCPKCGQSVKKADERVAKPVNGKTTARWLKNMSFRRTRCRPDIFRIRFLL